MKPPARLCLAVLILFASLARAEEDFTVYELLAPETHKFAIVYDVMTSVEGARFYLNPNRARIQGFRTSR